MTLVGQAFQPDTLVGQAFQPDSSGPCDRVTGRGCVPPRVRLESLTYKKSQATTPDRRRKRMCLLAILHRVCADTPLVVGANREEYYARGGDPPRRLDDAVAGVDPVQGGTGLGVNARGVLIAVTNRPGKMAPDAPRSRGLLARDLLDCASAAEAVERATRALDGGPYAGCNFFCADGRDAVVIHAG